MTQSGVGPAAHIWITMAQIELNLDYEFSNKVFDLAFGRVFNNLANNMVQSFTMRAKEVYG